MTEYPNVDFSQLLTPGVKYAVRCENENEARCLVASIKEQYPAKAKYWNLSSICWSNDNGGRDGGRMYFPHLNNCGGFDHLVYGSKLYAIENGYQIVTFQSLINDDDLAAESDMTLESLLGL